MTGQYPRLGGEHPPIPGVEAGEFYSSMTTTADVAVGLAENQAKQAEASPAVEENSLGIKLEAVQLPDGKNVLLDSAVVRSIGPVAESLKTELWQGFARITDHYELNPDQKFAYIELVLAKLAQSNRPQEATPPPVSDIEPIDTTAPAQEAKPSEPSVLGLVELEDEGETPDLLSEPNTDLTEELSPVDPDEPAKKTEGPVTGEVLYLADTYAILSSGKADKKRIEELEQELRTKIEAMVKAQTDRSMATIEANAKLHNQGEGLDPNLRQVMETKSTQEYLDRFYQRVEESMANIASLEKTEQEEQDDVRPEPVRKRSRFATTTRVMAGLTTLAFASTLGLGSAGDPEGNADLAEPTEQSEGSGTDPSTALDQLGSIDELLDDGAPEAAPEITEDTQAEENSSEPLSETEINTDGAENLFPGMEIFDENITRYSQCIDFARAIHPGAESLPNGFTKAAINSPMEYASNGYLHNQSPAVEDGSMTGLFGTNPEKVTERSIELGFDVEKVLDLYPDLSQAEINALRATEEILYVYDQLRGPIIQGTGEYLDNLEEAGLLEQDEQGNTVGSNTLKDDIENEVYRLYAASISELYGSSDKFAGDAEGGGYVLDIYQGVRTNDSTTINRLRSQATNQERIEAAKNEEIDCGLLIDDDGNINADLINALYQEN